MLKFFRRNLFLSACLITVLLVGITGASYTWVFTSEVGFSPPSPAEWTAAHPTYKFKTSDNLPYTWEGKQLGGVFVEVYATTTTNRTIAQWETGSVYADSTAASDDRVTFNLPAAKAGMRYSFVKRNSTVSSVLWLQSNTGDTINAGTASKAYKCTGTTQPQACGIVAIADGIWVIQYQVGTWANDNS